MDPNIAAIINSTKNSPKRGRHPWLRTGRSGLAVSPCDARIVRRPASRRSLSSRTSADARARTSASATSATTASIPGSNCASSLPAASTTTAAGVPSAVSAARRSSSRTGNSTGRSSQSTTGSCWRASGGTTDARMFESDKADAMRIGRQAHADCVQCRTLPPPRQPCSGVRGCWLRLAGMESESARPGGCVPVRANLLARRSSYAAGASRAQRHDVSVTVMGWDLPGPVVGRQGSYPRASRRSSAHMWEMSTLTSTITSRALP